MNSPDSAGFDRALLLMQARRYQEAASVLQQHIIHSPQDSAALAYLALCATELDQRQAATEYAQAAVAADPELSFAHYALALTFLARNRLPEANATIDAALQLDPDSVMNFALKAQIRFGQRDWLGARLAAEQGLRLESTDENCANLQAMALRQLRQGGQAEETIRTTLARDPENSDSHANLGWSLLEQGKSREALKHFQEALRLDPESEFARSGLVHALRARFIVYRWLFGYFAWVSKFSTKYAWLIVIGGVVGYQILRGLARQAPVLAPLIIPIMLAYTIFALSTWLLTPLTNLLLLSSRYGRSALPKEEKLTALAVLLCLGAGVGLTVAWLVNPLWPVDVFGLAVMVGLLALPVSAVASCDRGWPRNAAYAIVAVLVLLIGLNAAALITHIRDGSAFPPLSVYRLPPEPESSPNESSSSDARSQEVRKDLSDQLEANKKRRAAWERKREVSLERRAFQVYTVLALLSQFAMIALQSASVRR
jgi:Flp pilus assembly protein TadD